MLKCFEFLRTCGRVNSVIDYFLDQALSKGCHKIAVSISFENKLRVAKKTFSKGGLLSFYFLQTFEAVAKCPKGFLDPILHGFYRGSKKPKNSKNLCIF
jgi:hypothetical protein